MFYSCNISATMTTDNKCHKSLPVVLPSIRYTSFGFGRIRCWVVVKSPFVCHGTVAFLLYGDLCDTQCCHWYTNSRRCGDRTTMHVGAQAKPIRSMWMKICQAQVCKSASDTMCELRTRYNSGPVNELSIRRTTPAAVRTAAPKQKNTTRPNRQNPKQTTHQARDAESAVRAYTHTTIRVGRLFERRPVFPRKSMCSHTDTRPGLRCASELYFCVFLVCLFFPVNRDRRNRRAFFTLTNKVERKKKNIILMTIVSTLGVEVFFQFPAIVFIEIEIQRSYNVIEPFLFSKLN